MKNYIKELTDLLSRIDITDDKGKIFILDEAIAKVVDLIVARKEKGNKVIFVGNGGSASIASHMATDLLKNAGIPAIAFNDSSLITCLGNDLGYEYIFAKPIEILAEKGDILFAISSSGKSRNILNATAQAKEKGCFLVTMSGVRPDNPLRKAGNINFYVPSGSYGYVEIIHLAICHCVADAMIESKT